MPIGTHSASEVTPPHHRFWDEALQRAVEDAAKQLNQGDSAWYSVKFVVEIVKTNPGWVDKHTVVLEQTDPPGS
jgi:hypothetical protein